jgi:hypothetical protein
MLPRHFIWYYHYFRIIHRQLHLLINKVQGNPYPSPNYCIFSFCRHCLQFIFVFLQKRTEIIDSAINFL